jgi:hypothetical protein
VVRHAILDPMIFQWLFERHLEKPQAQKAGPAPPAPSRLGVETSGKEQALAFEGVLGRKIELEYSERRLWCVHSQLRGHQDEGPRWQIFGRPLLNDATMALLRQNLGISASAGQHDLGRHGSSISR